MTSPTQENALDNLRAQLEDWGIGSLYGDVVGYVTAGYSVDTINIRLQQTDAYKTRFAANDARKQQGLSVLSPAEYIATERQYRSLMQTVGLPAGFYDDTSDFTDFLSKDISPTELNDRVGLAKDHWMQADPYTRDALRNGYGFTDGDAIASILDPDKAYAVIERRMRSAGIGAEALRNNLNWSAQSGERLADLGVTQDQARSGFGEIGQTLGTDTAIGRRFGQDFTQTDAEDATLVGLASATRKRDQGRSDEAANFRSGAGASGGALSGRSDY